MRTRNIRPDGQTDEQNLARRTRRAGIVLCAGIFAGVVISFPMWLSERDFPRTPVWQPLDALALPAPWDTLAILSFFVALFAAAISGRRTLFAACFVLALLLAAPDMQRWQPWFFQYAFMLGAMAFVRREDSAGILRVIVAFTYIYSGLQKVHMAYFDGGMDFFLEPFGLAETLSSISYVAPFIELLVGVGLLFARTRSLAAITALGMHSFILFALSPLGQDWNVVVWPWNIAMMAFVILLFFRAPERVSLAPVRTTYGLISVAFFVVLPAFGLFGMWPSYLSSSLYSLNTKSALIYDGQDYAPAGSLTMNEFDTPVYPETAVFESAAGQACRRYETRLSGRPVMQINARPDPLTGERSTRIYGCRDLPSSKK